MADVLISFDEAGYLSIKAVYNRIAETIQGIVDSYNLLGFGDLVAAELEDLLNAPIDLIFDKMTGGEPVTIMGMAVHKDKAIDLLVKPDGYDALMSRISEVANNGIRDIHLTSVMVNKKNIPGIYTIDETGNVVITADFDAKLQNQNKKLAKTDIAKKILAFAQDIIAAAEARGITGHIKEHPGGLEAITGAILISGNQKDLALNPKYIVGYNEPHYRAVR